ncbi:hypothetical protein [Chitinophaga sp. sic0106]|uniref:hypothetical protein n=1 Tax=Chitinophaga sp. sic0106 TaxID=2854785 RepID=UPI001C483C46|nr:hypothetical protein [Chitinophaga sp. sic0106]MBV7529591.1 hypothetical protein [Chitinophaga sp. sic0106]
MAIQHRKEDYFEQLIAEAFQAFNRLVGNTAPTALQDLEARINELLTPAGLTLASFEQQPIAELEAALKAQPQNEQLLELIADTLQQKGNSTQQPALAGKAQWLYQYLMNHQAGNSISYSLLMKVKKPKK